MKHLFLSFIIITTIIGIYYVGNVVLQAKPQYAKAADFPSTENTTHVQSKKSAITEKEDLEDFDAESIRISNNEKNLLARLVHAEAKGESFAGKVAVAEVVLNRLEHEEFPDTLKEVIYEKNAFEPVQNGSINESADNESHQAVEEALEKEESDVELLYFYNPETATSDWILSRKVVKKIGNHAFAI